MSLKPSPMQPKPTVNIQHSGRAEVKAGLGRRAAVGAQRKALTE